MGFKKIKFQILSVTVFVPWPGHVHCAYSQFKKPMTCQGPFVNCLDKLFQTQINQVVYKDVSFCKTILQSQRSRGLSSSFLVLELSLEVVDLSISLFFFMTCQHNNASRNKFEPTKTILVSLGRAKIPIDQPKVNFQSRSRPTAIHI